jgi:hypothetical protein
MTYLRDVGFIFALSFIHREICLFVLINAAKNSQPEEESPSVGKNEVKRRRHTPL